MNSPGCRILQGTIRRDVIPEGILQYQGKTKVKGINTQNSVLGRNVHQGFAITSGRLATSLPSVTGWNPESSDLRAPSVGVADIHEHCYRAFDAR